MIGRDDLGARHSVKVKSRMRQRDDQMPAFVVVWRRSFFSTVTEAIATLLCAS